MESVGFVRTQGVEECRGYFPSRVSENHICQGPADMDMGAVTLDLRAVIST